MEKPVSLMQIAAMKRMGIREVWMDEALHFTPWLAENIHLLGESLGMCLEVQETEKFIGIFRADIVASDVATGEVVLIENQLDRTDHSHLGQLLTYASGVRAITIVWVAGQFSEEHRSALDWLNEFAGKSLHFFGVEIELWSIAGSLPAAKFNIVSKPNSWKQSLLPVTIDHKSAIYGLLDEDITLGQREIARRLNCSPATVRRYRAMYMAEREQITDSAIELEESLEKET